MQTLYVSQQGCYICLNQELLLVKRENQVLAEVQLPLLEQVLVFGKSQVTTQAIRSCLWRDIPIVYLSRMGYCYGRIIAIERGYRQLNRYQQEVSFPERLLVARAIVKGKLHNGLVFLKRQNRQKDSSILTQSIQTITYLMDKTCKADSLEQLMGYEGAGASAYFSALGDCITNTDFSFYSRSRRPPGNEFNAMLSFGYQVIWNHLLILIELQGLDPYQACLHQGSERHAALASDLIEEFRTPVIDSLVLYLVNRRLISSSNDFVFANGGCYLNDSGRKKFLGAFVQRMEELVDTGKENKQPRWDILMGQVKRYKEFIYNPVSGYQPYQIK